MKNYFTRTKAKMRLSAWRAVGLFTFLSVIGMQSAKAQYTTIPDANFEQALFDLGIDTVNGDHQVLTSAISGVTDLDVSSKSIADLTGVLGFTSLTSLNCSTNSLTSLNVIGLTSLQYFYCYDNQITNLNVTGLTALVDLDCSVNPLLSLSLATNTNLIWLNCSGSQLTSLNLSGLSALYTLNCSGSQLTSLNVSGLTSLYSLNCSSSQLTSLNVSGLPSLYTLDCSFNYTLSTINLLGLSSLDTLNLISCNLSSLNLTGLTNLYDLDCSSNQLSTLNITGLASLVYLKCGYNILTSLITTGATNLATLNCVSNQLTSLNMSSLTNLQTLYCDYNNITTLDLSSLTSLSSFTSTYNYSLSCISVADVAAALSSGWSIDSWSTFKLLSSPCIYTAIPDANFEQALIDLGHDTIIDGKVLTSSVSSITTLDVSNKSISYLNGIKSFTALQHLNCSSNTLYGFDLTGLTNLKTIDCSYSNIGDLLITNTTSLTSLNCSGNALTTLNLSGLTNLKTLSCGSNQLTSLNFTGITHLTTLDCSYNTLPTISYTSLNTLTSLDCSGTGRTSLSLTGMTNLVSLKFYDNLLTTINLSGLSNLKTLDCSSNKFTSINLSGLTSLESFSCGDNLLVALNLFNMPTLKELYCIGKFSYSTIGGVITSTYTSTLTSITLDGLTNLQTLDCSVNKLTAMNLFGLTALKSLKCGNNNITSLNLNAINFPALIDLDCSGYSIGQTGIISSLNLTGFSGLQTLNCSRNLLTSFNLTGLTSLTTLYCGRNSFTSLSVNSTTFPALTYLDCNGGINHGLINSLNLTGLTNSVQVSCYGNPNLTCITVSDPVAAAANNNWSKDATAGYSTNCGAAPTSKVKANQCGTTLTSLDQNINADYVAGYEQYRFEVTNGATVNTVDVNKYNFSLTQTPGITNGTTYGVRVAVKMGGSWGAYGASCNVTTPALASNTVLTTHVHPNFCGVTLAALTTKIPAKPVFNAQGYRFEITTGGVTTVYDSASYIFKLSQAGVVVDYGMTYTIRVAALVNGVYGDYGVSCSVATPVLATSSVPTTQIHPNFCGTTLTALDTKIPASPVSGATGYRFEITTAGVTTVYDSTLYLFKLSQAGVVVANGTTYAIRVAALVNGVYGNFGVSCNVYTLGATAREYTTSTEFAVAAYPNPFNSAFKLQVTASTDETIFVSVYDMMGKQVENREVNASEIENATIGQDFSAGIYNVLVSQGVNTKTVRLVKN